MLPPKNVNGIKTRDLIIKILLWTIPIGAAAGSAAAMLGSHEIRITIVEEKIDAYAVEQRKQTEILQKILDKP